MRGVGKRGYGRATKAPPDERGGKQTCPAYRHRATSRLYPYSADPWGASGNAPGSGTAELTKFEIPPHLDNDEIAGWRRRGHRDADARRGARIFSRSLGASAPPRHSLLHGGIHSTVEWKRAAYRHFGFKRFGHHRDPGRVRRGGCERGLILGFGLW